VPLICLQVTENTHTHTHTQMSGHIKTSQGPQNTLDPRGLIKKNLILRLWTVYFDFLDNESIS